MKVKPDKCFFLREQVRYLGHIVSKNGIESYPEKTTKVKHWSLPRNVKEVQQFLGFANYYQRFIKSFAEIAKPLHKLTERSAVAFRWTLECHAKVFRPSEESFVIIHNFGLPRLH